MRCQLRYTHVHIVVHWNAQEGNTARSFDLVEEFLVVLLLSPAQVGPLCENEDHTGPNELLVVTEQLRILRPCDWVVQDFCP